MKSYLKAIIKLTEKCVVKVLEVDKNDEYKILYIDKRELKSNSPFLKDWVNDHVAKNLIPEDYIEGFKHYVNSEYAFKALKYKKYIHYKFKRKITTCDDWTESVITILPKDENTIYLVVYNIE